MPRRIKSEYKEHNGKYRYVSPNYQRDWSVTDDKKLIVKSNIELEQGNSIETSTTIPLTSVDVSVEDKNVD